MNRLRILVLIWPLATTGCIFVDSREQIINITAPETPTDTTDTTSVTPSDSTISLTPEGGEGALGTTLQTVATCKIGGAVFSCSPRWYSSHPSIISVDSSRGILYRLNRGSAEICVQWSLTEINPRACHQFTVN